MKRDKHVIVMVFSILIVLIFSLSCSAFWWNFGQQEEPPQVTITSIGGKPIPGHGIIVVTESMNDTTIAGTASSAKAPIRRVDISLDGGSSWQEGTMVNGTWSYSLSLFPGDIFFIKAQAQDALGRVSPESPEISFTYQPLPTEEMVVEMLEGLMNAYRNQDILTIMSYISSDFYGGEELINAAIMSDFAVFRDVQLLFHINALNINPALIIITAQWTLIYQREGEGATRRKSGNTVLTFNHSLELLSMRGNPIFGTTSPYIADIAGTELEYNLVIEKTGEGTLTPAPGNYEYLEGTEVQLKATPKSGWSFGGWSGHVVSSNREERITMNGDKLVKATFNQIFHTLTMKEPEGEGTVTPSPGDHPSPSLKEVTLSATPKQGWFFSHWIGDVKDPDKAQTTIFMDKDKEVQAIFDTIMKVATPAFSLTPGSYAGAQEVIITTETPEATIYYTMDGSVPNQESTPYTGPVTINRDTTLKAVALKEGMIASDIASGVYQITYTLILTIDPLEGGEVIKNPDKANYSYGEEVTLTASPKKDYGFRSWEGDGTGTDEILVVTIDRNKEIQANFELLVYQLNLLVEGEGRVKAHINQVGPEEWERGEHKIPIGASLEMEAIPSLGWRLVSWEGDGSPVIGFPEKRELIMNRDKEVKVIFTDKTPQAYIKAEFLGFGPTKVYTITVVEAFHLQNASRFTIKDSLGVDSETFGTSITRNTLSDRMKVFLLDQGNNVLATGEVEFQDNDFEGIIDLE